jgi:transposase-like protein
VSSFFELTERYPNEESAVRYFEERRWPTGVRCPKCGTKNVVRGKQKKRRRQLWYCHGCKYQFSVTSGTVMENTKLPLRKWLFAFHLIGASKKGISALQVSRMLKTTYRAAWHLCHRIRATMADNDQLFTGTVETDETYIGGKRKGMGRGYRGNKMAVQTIVQRSDTPDHDGKAQTMALNNGQKVDGRTVGAKLRKHTTPGDTMLMTDESPIYNVVGESFAEHRTVNHSKEEYVRRDPDGVIVSTNTAEGLFANLKRQIIGTHHHTSHKHLPRYLEEYDYKYNTREANDTDRTEAAIERIEDARLTLFKSVGGGDSLFDRKAGEKAPRPGKKREKKKTKRTVLRQEELPETTVAHDAPTQDDESVA